MYRTDSFFMTLQKKLTLQALWFQTMKKSISRFKPHSKIIKLKKAQIESCFIIKGEKSVMLIYIFNMSCDFQFFLQILLLVCYFCIAWRILALPVVRICWKQILLKMSLLYLYSGRIASLVATFLCCCLLFFFQPFEEFY